MLLALPFFIFAGLIIERVGISLRLVQFVHALVGHLRGGLSHVTSMYLVSGLSGSKTADIASVGSVMRELHYGIVLLIAMGVGAFLPPAGIGFYRRPDDRRLRSWFTVFLPKAFNLGG